MCATQLVLVTETTGAFLRWFNTSLPAFPQGNCCNIAPLAPKNKWASGCPPISRLAAAYTDTKT